MQGNELQVWVNGANPVNPDRLKRYADAEIQFGLREAAHFFRIGIESRVALTGVDHDFHLDQLPSNTLDKIFLWNDAYKNGDRFSGSRNLHVDNANQYKKNFF